MATVKQKNEGKSMFLKEYFVDHPDAGKEAIDAAWREAGNEGTISPSLIGQVRKDLGLTGQGTAQGKSRGAWDGPAVVGWLEVRRPRGRPRGRRPNCGDGEQQAYHGGCWSGPAAPQAAGGDRTRMLIRLEGAIDDLLHEIKMAGGLPEFEETLRKARRILARSHGE